MLKVNMKVPDAYYIDPIRDLLGATQGDVPPYTICDEAGVLAFVHFADNPVLNTKWYAHYKVDAPVVLKFQYDKRLTYPTNVIPVGLYRYADGTATDLLNRSRPIDLIAQMRVKVGGGGQEFARCRENVIEQAKSLSKQYNVRHTMVHHRDYMQSLSDVNVAFLWSGVGPLCWKIVEFLQHGVIFITPPLDNYPYKGDVIISEDVCIYAELKDFKKEAVALLKDKQKQMKLRKNILDFWNQILSPKQMKLWLEERISRNAKSTETM